MNFAFYVSGKGTRLRKILKEYDINKDVLKSTSLIFSDSQDVDDLKEELESIGIKYHSYIYNSISNNKKDLNSKLSNEILKVFKENLIDYCFCFGDHILKGTLLSEYRNRIVNFHPSLLPAFPGRLAIDQALKSGVKVLGNTAHFIDEGIDTGPIILQNIVPVEAFNLKGYDGILDNQVEMLRIIYRLILNEKLKVDGRFVTIEENAELFNIITPLNKSKIDK